MFSALSAFTEAQGVFTSSIDISEDSTVVTDSLAARKSVMRSYSPNENESFFAGIFPQSPQSQALARYGEYPVSMTTGVPDITIPLYEIKVGEFTLPISISYHASGIRMDDVASTVGLGWSLNAGGVITSTVNGTPDLLYGNDKIYWGYDTLRTFLNGVINSGMSNSTLERLLQHTRQPGIDTASDRYTFNFAGKSGIFLYSPAERRYIPINYDRMSIHSTPNSDNDAKDCTFSITDTKGYHYYFNKQEMSGVVDDEDRTDVSSWYLTKIETPYGDIDITYYDTPKFFKSHHSEDVATGTFRYYDNSESYGYRRESRPTLTNVQCTFRIPVVKDIRWNGNIVSFHYEDDRADIWKTRLTRMEVKNNADKVVKTVDFHNSHYWGNQALNYRMILDSITVSGEGCYSMTYNINNGYLPDYNQYTCFQRDGTHTRPVPISDYWGYYTGRTAYCCIPQSVFSSSLGGSINSQQSHLLSRMTEKTPVEFFTKLGIINYIEYPTGGRTAFSFEMNSYNVGGLRVKTISNYNNRGDLLMRKQYSYAGVVTTDAPATTMRYNASHVCDTYPFPGATMSSNNVICTSTPVFPLTNTPGIFYNYVTETDLNGDRINYEYMSDPTDYTLSGYTGGNIFQLEYPFTHDYGNIDPYLTKKTYFSASGVKMRTETYDYAKSDVKRLSTGNKLISLARNYSCFGGYSNILSGDMINSACLKMDSMTIHSRVCRLSRKTVTDNVTNTTSVEDYTYDQGFNTSQPKTQSITNSDGRMYTTEYLYPFESSDEGIRFMSDYCNMYDEVIGKKSFCNDVLLKSSKRDYLYKNFWFYPSSDSLAMLHHGYYERERVIGYGNKGNITKVLSKGIDTDSISWDSTEVYPLTHMRNGKTIAQYAWKPLVGVTQITGENGFSTNYLYDNGARLSGIFDAYGQHNAFYYNYRNSNGTENAMANYVRSITYNQSQQGNPAISYQYYDDIGRPTHTRSYAVGTGGVPVYTFYSYDSKGRPAWQSLPASSVTDTIPDRLVPSDVMTECYGDSLAYSQTIYDALDRVGFTSTPGRDWHTAGKGVTREYVTNGTDDVKLYHAPINSLSLTKDGYYPEHSLYGERTTDEDGHTLTVFTDKIGRKVLERKTIDSTYNDTYYIYNDLGQLRFVLTPEYQHSGYKAVNGYEYRYDERGRIVKKILPQCEYIQYWYDKSDRLTFMQDANLRAKGRYRFMLYDGMGRIAVQGLCRDCQRDFYGERSYPRVTLSTADAGLLNTGYTLNCAGLLTEPSLEAVNYYDDYHFLNNPGIAYSFSGLSHSSGVNVSGLQTGSITMTSDGSHIAMLTSYDEKGRVTQTSTSKPGNLREDVHTTYTFTGQPHTVTQSLIAGNDTILSSTQENVYNAYNDKLTLSSLSLTSQTSTGTSWTNTYDDLGRVTNISRPQAVGGIGYAYNLHGWTTDIATNSFAEKLHYTDGVGTPCYNGNISSMLWSNSTYKKNGENVWRGYTFTYDDLDRMTDAIYGEGESLTDKSNRYNESILSYNANSAIKRLQRRGLKQDGEYGKIDNLNIQLDGSRITKVTDDAAPITYSGAIDFVDGADLSVEYTYDGNGNLTSDANKGISLIEYDNMNMPKRIQFTNGNTIEYIYTASGQKLRTIYYTASTQQKDSTEYFLGGLLTRKNNNLDKYLFDGGYFSFDNNTTTCHYYNRDHLGNIREVISQTGDIEQVTHYYPFGTPFSDNSVINPDLQSYKYNGKEFDSTHNLFTYDYGTRQYDPILITWGKVDPMSEMDYGVSMYGYCLNNPITFVDLFGLKAYDVKEAKKSWNYFNPQEDEIVLDELRVIGHYRQETRALHSGANSIWDSFRLNAPSKGDWIGATNYAGEHIEGRYSALSTREKSKYTYDALKFARNKFGWKYKGRNADIYKRTIPRFLKNANKVLRRGNVIFVLGDNAIDIRKTGRISIGNIIDVGVMATTTMGTLGVAGTAGILSPFITGMGIVYLSTDVILEITTDKGIRSHLNNIFE